MNKNQFAQKAGSGCSLLGFSRSLKTGITGKGGKATVSAFSRLSPQSFFLTQTNQYKSKLRILITYSFSTKASKSALKSQQQKPLAHSQTKESFTKANAPAKANFQPLVLDSLKLPQKKLDTRPLKSGIDNLLRHFAPRRNLLSPSKKKIKKETQNLRTIFQEASFSPLFSLQKEHYKKLVENQGLRAVWKAKVINSSVPAEKRKEAMQALAQLPKNPLHSPRLCILSGRSKGVYKKFRLSRHNMRSLLSQGILQGVKKASW